MIRTNKDIPRQALAMPINPKHPEKFWEGYRAFVFGGRRTSSSGRGGKTRVLDSSIEPYADFSDEEKEQWRAGILYAKKERKECRALPADGRPSFLNCKTIVLKMWNERRPINEIAYECNATRQSVRAWIKRLSGKSRR